MKSKQAGNAILIILIAVFLFGALAATFMRGSRTGQSNLTTQQAKLIAQELTAYTKSIERSLDKLRVRGCSENQLTFQSIGIAGYTNPLTPSSGECDVFTGTNLTYSAPQESWLDNSYQGSSNFGHYLFIGGSSVFGVGDEGSCLLQADVNKCTDLMVILRYVRKDVCVAVNDLLGIENSAGDPPVDTGFYDNKFTGSMAYAWGEFGDDASSAELGGHSAGCFQNTGNPTNSSYNFYTVLLAR